MVAALSVAAQLYIPILCGRAIDRMLGPGQVDLPGVVSTAGQVALTAVGAALAQWLLSLCNNHIAFSVSRDLRNAAQQRLQVLPLAYLDGHPAGDILSRMVADVDTFADGRVMGFTQLFASTSPTPPMPAGPCSTTSGTSAGTKSSWTSSGFPRA